MSMRVPSSSTVRPIRVAMVTNIPAPYRIPVLERLASQPGCELQVVYCSGIEPDRAWRLAQGAYQATYLQQRFVTIRGRYVHINPDVWSALRKAAPDVVITTGFNPTHLLAFAYARLHGVAHVAMTDGTWISENLLSRVHRFLRRVVYASSGAFIGASEGSMALYKSYGLPESRMFKSHLCANNAAFLSHPPAVRVHDLLVAGRIVAGKNPLFALAVAQRLAQRLQRAVSLAFLGSGEMEAEVRAAAAQLPTDQVQVDFLGFAQQDELPEHYARARILLFPTAMDTWGVVANEACASGVPVIVTPEAGVAGDLVVDGVNGRVMPMDVDAWAAASQQLLSDEGLYAKFSQAAKERVTDYNFDAAALGIWQAVQMAAGRQHGSAASSGAQAPSAR